MAVRITTQLIGFLAVSASLFVLAIFALRVAIPTLSKENFITIGGFYFTSCAVILAFFGLRTNLRYSQKKAAADFIFSTVPTQLIPSLRGISEHLGNEPFLAIVGGSSYAEVVRGLPAERAAALRGTVHSVLNFYERMAITILTGVLDEEVCYDESGLMMVKFHRWVRSYIRELQEAHGERRIFSNFTHLAGVWAARIDREAARDKSGLTLTLGRRPISDQELKIK